MYNQNQVEIRNKLFEVLRGAESLTQCELVGILDELKTGIIFNNLKPTIGEMNDNGPVVLTKEKIEACRGKTGAYTAATVEAFGLCFPLKEKWIENLIGKTISGGDYQKACEGRFIVKGNK
jgi:hypothetical protein